MMPAFSAATSSRLEAGEERFLITGAGGWLGRALVEMLAASLGGKIAERVVLCGSSSRPLPLSNGMSLPIHALDEGLALLEGCPAFICHFAFLTKDRVGQMSDREYVERNRELGERILEAARRMNARGMLLSSSGAVYDYLHAGERDGAANLYGRLKAEDEQRFTQFCQSHGIPLIVPRIFNVGGPFINKFDAYALSSIIVDVLNGGPIRLRAAKSVYRSYMHVADIHELSLRSLLEAVDGAEAEIQSFDTRGEEVLEVGELAVRARFVMGHERTPIVRPELVGDASDYYVGDPQALAKLLLKYGCGLIGVDQQIAETAAYIRQTLEVA